MMRGRNIKRINHNEHPSYSINTAGAKVDPVKLLEEWERLQKNRRKYRFYRVAILFICLTLLSLTGWIGLSYHRYNQLGNQIPKSIRNSANFPIYVPYTLPDGFKIDKNSVILEQGVLLFNLKNGDRTLSISQQARPEEFSLDKFYDKQIEGRKFQTSLGSAAIGAFGKQQIGTLITDKTWVMINNSQAGLSQANLEELIRSLK